MRGVRNSRPKTAHLLELAAKWMLRRYPSCYFATFTFAENVTDLAEAKKRWRPVADYFRRHNCMAIGVWQLQPRRGVWHCHVVINARMNILELRGFCMNRGWGSFINLRRVSMHGSNSIEFGKDVDRTARYMVRYMVRDLPTGAAGSCLTIYVGRGARVGNVRFAWVGGLSAVWRAGVGMYWELYHRKPPLWNPKTKCVDGRMSDYLMRLGLEVCMGRHGFEGIESHPRFWRLGDTLGPPPEGQPF